MERRRAGTLARRTSKEVAVATEAAARKQVQTRELETPSREEMLGYYRMMVLIRRFEEKCAEMYARGKIGGFLHLYIGEEAVAVGAISTLQPQDVITSHYREHGHALARGMDPNGVMAELFGKSTGCSKGKGGSMHLFDAELGFYGGSAIVGGQMPLGVGLGLASKLQDNNQRVSLCIIGDGAVQEGEFHEAMNLASLWKLPVVFLCENNGYGMGTAVEMSFAGTAIYERAHGYGMPGIRCDGMNLLEVKAVTQEAVDRARRGEGPTLIEVITYRFRGHSMADPVEYRQKDEEEEWKRHDPIPAFRQQLLDMGVTEEEIGLEDSSAEGAVEESLRFAEESPFPSADDLWQDTYAPAPWVDKHLQMLRKGQE